MARLDKPPSGQRQHVRADVDRCDLAGRTDATRCRRGNCPCTGAEVKDTLTRIQIATVDYVLDNGGESRVDLAPVEFRDPIPYTNLPFEASSLGISVYDCLLNEITLPPDSNYLELRNTVNTASGAVYIGQGSWRLNGAISPDSLRRGALVRRRDGRNSR